MAEVATSPQMHACGHETDEFDVPGKLTSMCFDCSLLDSKDLLMSAIHEADQAGVDEVALLDFAEKLIELPEQGFFPDRHYQVPLTVLLDGYADNYGIVDYINAPTEGTFEWARVQCLRWLWFVIHEWDESMADFGDPDFALDSDRYDDPGWYLPTHRGHGRGGPYDGRRDYKG